MNQDQVKAHVTSLIKAANIIRFGGMGIAIALAFWYGQKAVEFGKGNLEFGTFICIAIVVLAAIISMIIRSRAMSIQATLLLTPPPPPQPAGTLRIARSGVDLGLQPWPTIMESLRQGTLTDQDHYLDTNSNQWLPLGTLKNTSPATPLQPARR